MSNLAKIKKGSSVILCGFTGMKLGVYKVTEATKTTITIEKADGTEVEFSRKTGKQLNVEEGKERYANSIMEDDGSYVKPERKKKKKVAKKKAKAKVKEEDDDDDDDDDDEDEEYGEVE